MEQNRCFTRRKLFQGIKKKQRKKTMQTVHGKRQAGGEKGGIEIERERGGEREPLEGSNRKRTKREAPIKWAKTRGNTQKRPNTRHLKTIKIPIRIEINSYAEEIITIKTKYMRIGCEIGTYCIKSDNRPTTTRQRQQLLAEYAHGNNAKLNYKLIGFLLHINWLWVLLRRYSAVCPPLLLSILPAYRVHVCSSSRHQFMMMMLIHDHQCCAWNKHKTTSAKGEEKTVTLKLQTQQNRKLWTNKW